MDIAIVRDGECSEVVVVRKVGRVTGTSDVLDDSLTTVEVDGTEVAVVWDDCEFCETDNGAVECEVKDDSLVAEREAARGGRGPLHGWRDGTRRMRVADIKGEEGREDGPWLEKEGKGYVQRGEDGRGKKGDGDVQVCGCDGKRRGQQQNRLASQPD